MSIAIVIAAALLWGRGAVVSFQSPRESCSDLARAANATVLQLIAWNPELGTDCAKLDRQTTGYTVCLSAPGGS